MSDWWQLCDWCNGGWKCVCRKCSEWWTPVQVISPGTWGVWEMESGKVSTQVRVPSGGLRREPQKSDSWQDITEFTTNATNLIMHFCHIEKHLTVKLWFWARLLESYCWSILSSFPHPHVIPNDFLLLTQNIFL